MFCTKTKARLVKEAASDEQTFESSLATIGRTYLASKAPNLFAHEIGFQVLDKSEDNDRAVGVFGFRVGRRILYVPLFYRDGVVKGTEQLRDPKSKLTVPLTDNWVNYFVSKGPDEGGEAVDRNRRKGTSEPSLWQLKYPPTKYAADESVLAHLAGAIGRPPRPFSAGGDFDLLKAAAACDRVLAGLDAWVRRYDWFADALASHYGRDKVALCLEASARRKAAAAAALPAILKPSGGVLELPAKTAAVTVVRVSVARLHATPLHPSLDLSESERSELASGRNAYRDSRGESDTSKSEPLVGAKSDGDLTCNPPESGVYGVLDEVGRVVRCAVVCEFAAFGHKHAGLCLVVPLEGKKGYKLTHRNQLWCHGQADHQAYRDWVASLPEFKEPSEHATYVAFDNNCAATAPFHCGPGGDCHPTGSWEAKDDAPYWAPRDVQSDPELRHLFESPRADSLAWKVRVLEGMHGKKMVVSGKRVYLPEGSRLLKLERGDSPFEPAQGSTPDWLLARMRKSASEGAKVLHARLAGDGGVSYEDPRDGSRRKSATVTDFEADLVELHGLSVPAARAFVVALSKNASHAELVKYAAPYAGMPEVGLSQSAGNAPSVDLEPWTNPGGFADDVVPTETSNHLAVPIDDLMEQPGARERYKPYPVQDGIMADVPGVGNGSEPAGPSEADVRMVADAARTGRKELFDTASLGALVKYTRLPSLLDKAKPKLLKTVTEIGDLLGHMYWNEDEWSERFGQSELGPLEDQLRGLFEGLGEAYLTLHEKAVQDAPDAGIIPDLDPGDGGDSGQSS